DRDRNDRHPVRAEDLLAAGPKLGASEGELLRLLERCGFRPAPTARSYPRPRRSPLGYNLLRSPRKGASDGPLPPVGLRSRVRDGGRRLSKNGTAVRARRGAADAAPRGRLLDRARGRDRESG